MSTQPSRVLLGPENEKHQGVTEGSARLNK